MKITLLVIAILVNGNIHSEATYPMSNIIECERVATNEIVIESYPGRFIFCIEK